VTTASQTISTEAKPTLTGTWQAQQWVMSGTTALECAADQSVQLQGTVRNAAFSSKLQLGKEPLQSAAR